MARRFDPAAALATGLGIGFLPIAPATWMSLVVVIVMGWIHAPLTLVRAGVTLALILAVTLAGTWAAGRAERRYGHDAHCIVIDEVAGMLLTAFAVPWGWPHLAVAFFLFRALDILKPPPVYQLQSLPGGAGVMADDLAAGVYGVALLLLARAVIPGF
jgi:phosphatidylglycerophosphatase A